MPDGGSWKPFKATRYLLELFGVVVFAAEHGLSGMFVAAAIMAIGGGTVRDVLCTEMPLILRRETYDTASIAGGTV